MTDNSLWVHRAACRGHDPEKFFPDQRANNAAVRQTITICLGCPVRKQCGDLAKQIGANHGIWAGVLIGADRKD